MISAEEAASFSPLPWLWMAAVIPPGSGLAVCVVPIHSFPKEGLQVRAQSAAAPREPWSGQLCWIRHFLQWSWKGMWTGRIALETIPLSQAEGKHYLERFILQAANPANANPAFETGLLINKASRGLLTAALKRKTRRKKWKRACDFILLFVLTAGWKYQVYQLLHPILVGFSGSILLLMHWWF